LTWRRSPWLKPAAANSPPARFRRKAPWGSGNSCPARQEPRLFTRGHGNDEKCADAAVRELYTKLEMAQGNLDRAKKLYCGQGPEADRYLRKIHKVHQELLTELDRQTEHLAMGEEETRMR